MSALNDVLSASVRDSQRRLGQAFQPLRIALLVTLIVVVRMAFFAIGQPLNPLAFHWPQVAEFAIMLFFAALVLWTTDEDSRRKPSPARAEKVSARPAASAVRVAAPSVALPTTLAAGQPRGNDPVQLCREILESSLNQRADHDLALYRKNIEFVLWMLLDADLRRELRGLSSPSGSLKESLAGPYMELESYAVQLAETQLRSVRELLMERIAQIFVEERFKSESQGTLAQSLQATAAAYLSEQEATFAAHEDVLNAVLEGVMRTRPAAGVVTPSFSTYEIHVTPPTPEVQP